MVVVAVVVILVVVYSSVARSFVQLYRDKTVQCSASS